MTEKMLLINPIGSIFVTPPVINQPYHHFSDKRFVLLTNLKQHAIIKILANFVHALLLTTG
jgi:hypothetical protein